MTDARRATIAPHWSVNDTLLRHPATIHVFNAFGVDACCGGAVALAEAAQVADIPIDDLLHALGLVVREGVEVPT